MVELFEEEFPDSPAHAKWKFRWTVIRYFRPRFIKAFHRRKKINPSVMFKNDIKVAWRSISKQPFFTLLNVFGLAIGIAGSILIALFLQDELSFDRMFQDADRIYRTDIDYRVTGEESYYATAPGPMAAAIKDDYPHIEQITRMREVGEALIRPADAIVNIKEQNVVGADSAFFELFGVKLLAGDYKTALQDPYTMVMTKTAAEKHFGWRQAVGKSMVLNDQDNYVVTGVVDDFPANSLFRDQGIFLSIESFEDASSVVWNNWSYPTYIKLRPQADPAELRAYLATVKEKFLIPWAMTFVPGLTLESARADEEATGNFMIFGATALTDIHLYSDRRGEMSSNSDIKNVYILSFIGFFLLVLAAVNFMNLSTAHSLKRAKEVGIRKTLGSDRAGLIRQFLTEAGVITALALLMGVLLAMITLPYFNELAEKTISFPYLNLIFWITVLGAALLLGLLAGAYPAFFMSRFLPVKVLKGGGETRVGGAKVRNSLVVFQFSISVFLIVCTLVVFQQLQFIRHTDLGFEKDQVLVVDDAQMAGPQLESFKEAVEQLGQVQSVSLSSYLPTPSARSVNTFFPEGAVTQGGRALNYGIWRVDHDYISTLDLAIIEGRAFDRQLPTDSSAIILNESALVMLGMNAKEAIGTRITSDFHREDKENMEYYTIIGVVKNFHYESLRSDINALSLVLGGDPNRLITKLQAGNFKATINQIRNIWNEVAPGQPFQHYFMDDSFNDTYQAELRLGSIFLTFTILSLFIACLGLFGLAAFNAQKRVKEVGIRKVLGASVEQLTYKLSVDFLKLVGLSVLIALPLGWWAMNQWLQDFAFRTEISWWILLAAASSAILISILTVSYQGLRAAIANPIESLRSE
ncbi:MAG: ABC transporter permease [Saprospiraceae bacterium]|nr:ABC transporter permease [Saprospiraceae bacterium]